MEDKNNATEQEKPNQTEYTIEILPDEYAQYDLSFKLIVIGNSGVGKSCLISKAAKDDFQEYYQATIGFEFLTFNLKLNNTVIKLQLWDTCGQEIYRSLISNFYRNSSLAIMVYAIDDLKSFQSMGSWLTELKTQSNPEVKIFLVGNKCDLEDMRKVDKESAEQFMKEHKLDMFFETSAKTGFNSRNLLIEAAKMLYNDYLNVKQNVRANSITKGKFRFTERKGASVKPVPQEEIKKKKGCCE